MPYATNPEDGVRIYYEVEGTGPPLMLLHGGGGSMERWRKYGYVAELRDIYQLILIDMRAHGRSDKPTDPAAYLYPRWVGDGVAVLDDLGIEKAHAFGYSLGGLVGFRFAAFAPERLRSLSTGGAHPFAEYDFWQSEYERYRNGGKRYLEQMEKEGIEVSESELEDLRAGVWEAVMAALRFEPGVEQELSQTDLPILIMAGADDTLAGVNRKAPEAARMIPGSELWVIDGHNHKTAFEDVDVVVPRLKAFLVGVEQEQ